MSLSQSDEVFYISGFLSLFHKQENRGNERGHKKSRDGSVDSSPDFLSLYPFSISYVLFSFSKPVGTAVAGRVKTNCALFTTLRSMYFPEEFTTLLWSLLCTCCTWGPLIFQTVSPRKTINEASICKDTSQDMKLYSQLQTFLFRIGCFPPHWGKLSN